MLGLTFKPNTDDMRDSPSIAIAQALADSGVELAAYDPEGMEQARVKGCGKSVPGFWQQRPHGKPHPEQGRIGIPRFFGDRVLRPRGSGLAAGAAEQSVA